MDPPSPKLDPPLPKSNVYIRVVAGNEPLNTFQRINLLSELKSTTVLPSEIIENPITIITLFYGKDINHSLALASTLLFKKGIEAEIRSGTLELGLVGLLDHNISFRQLLVRKSVPFILTRLLKTTLLSALWIYF